MSQKPYLLLYGGILLVTLLSLYLLHSEPVGKLISDYAARELETYVTTTAAAETTIADMSQVLCDRTIPFSDLPRKTLNAQPCSAQSIPDEEIDAFLTEIVFCDITAVVFRTTAGGLYAAVKTEDSYAVLQTISENAASFPYTASITLEPFSDVLGQSGIRLSHPVGANAVNDCYFTFREGIPSMMVSFSRPLSVCGDMLIEQYSMGGIFFVYRLESDGIVQYDIAQAANGLFPDAQQIWLSYPGMSEEEIVIEVVSSADTASQDRYIGWFDETGMHIRKDVKSAELAK